MAFSFMAASNKIIRKGGGIYINNLHNANGLDKTCSLKNIATSPVVYNLETGSDFKQNCVTNLMWMRTFFPSDRSNKLDVDS
jgi:hypothetical protein